MRLNKISTTTTQSILLVISLIAYFAMLWPALTGPFIFDDFSNIKHLALIENDLAANLGDYLAAFEGNPGRPIAALSFLLNDNAWPSVPFGFKYTNLLFHMLNAVLLFGLLRQLASTSSKLPKNPIWPLLAMAVWLFHPLQISSQMLVVQRMTLLAGTFSLAGLWAYTALLQRSTNWRGAFLAITALGFATLLAILCKENGALLPLYALVLNITILAGLVSEKDKSSQRLIMACCALPTLLVAYMIQRMGFQPDAFLHREFTLLERLLTQMHVLFDYTQQIFMPSIAGSGIYHDDYPLYSSLFKPISTLIFLTVIIGSIVCAIVFRKRFALVSFAVLWYFGGHIIESTVLPLEIYFEHRNYLPMLGILVALTSVPFLLDSRKRTAATLLTLWLVLLMIITAAQAPVWGSTAKIATFWAKEHPMSLRAAQELAKFNYELGRSQDAVNVLMEAYNRGINSSDLPLTAVLAKCWNSEINYPEDLREISNRAIKKSQYSITSLDVLQKLRESIENERCLDYFDNTFWWALSDALLDNRKFKKSGGHFIYLERAKMQINDKNLQGTMVELEHAYKIRPSIELSYQIANILLSAGLLAEAEIWLKKGMELKKPWFKEWLSSDKNKSRALIELIEQTKMQNSMNTIPATPQNKE